MTLYDFIHQMVKTTGNKSGDQFAIKTTLQYINEEVAFVSKRFPEKASFTLPITSAGYYHTLDLTDLPIVLIDNLMVSGVGADKTRWKILKARIGNAV